MSLEPSQDANPPWRVSPVAKHSAKSRLSAGRDVRHFCSLDLGNRNWRGDERGGLSLLSPCTLHGVLRQRATATIGPWWLWFLEPSHSPSLLRASCCGSHSNLRFRDSAPSLPFWGRCPFPPSTFLPVPLQSLGLAWPHSHRGPQHPSVRQPGSAGAWLSSCRQSSPPSPAAPRWGCKQTNKHPSTKPQQLRL